MKKTTMTKGKSSAMMAKGGKVATKKMGGSSYKVGGKKGM